MTSLCSSGDFHTEPSARCFALQPPVTRSATSGHSPAARPGHQPLSLACSSGAGKLQVRADPAAELRPRPLPLPKGQHQPLKEELQLQRHRESVRRDRRGWQSDTRENQRLGAAGQPHALEERLWAPAASPWGTKRREDRPQS